MPVGGDLEELGGADWGLRLSWTTARSGSVHRGGQEIPGPAPESTQQRRTTLMAWGPINEDWGWRALLPHTRIRQRTATGGGVDLDGVGDLSLYVEGRQRGAWNLLAGFELPTGEDAPNPGPGLTPPTLLQLGSGTFDPMVGLRYLGEGETWIPTASLLLVQPIGRSDAGLHPGRSWRARAGGYWRARPWLTPSLHLEGLRRSPDALDGARLADTGGTIWTLIPAVNLEVGGGGLVRIGWRIPLDEEVEGTQLVPGGAFTIEGGWSF